MSLFLYVCNVFKKNEKYTSLAAEKEPVSFVSRAIFDSICRGYVSFHSIIKTDSSSGQPINDLLWVVLCVLFRAQSEIQMLTGHYDTSCCIFAALFLKKNHFKGLDFFSNDTSFSSRSSQIQSQTYKASSSSRGL
jgi:hypothetical protein